MSFVTQTTVTCYLLPQDGAAAKVDFLQHLLSRGETWIKAYAIMLPDMISELLEAHRQGVPRHLYLDHLQEVGETEQPLVQQLVNAGVEVTIGTSPAGSKFICYTKGIFSDQPKTGDPVWCWEGSENFWLNAWQQANTVMVFSSQDRRDELVAKFEALRDFAWANERNLQLMSVPPADLARAAPSRAQDMVQSQSQIVAR
jgi:hypothetical protein